MVINRSAAPRVVLIVNVPRPLPLVPRLINAAVLWGWPRRRTRRW
jgi:hypothetical protein